MKEKADWIPYQELDFLDPENNVFNIDTRDFHAGYRFENNRHDIDTIKKYPDFFHTKEEIIELLNRYFIESGGECEWRMFSLDGNWNLKYIRIWRTELGFIVCDYRNKALRKSYLNQEVYKEY
jgi:hypothetical protein